MSDRAKRLIKIIAISVSVLLCEAAYVIAVYFLGGDPLG